MRLHRRFGRRSMNESFFEDNYRPYKTLDNYQDYDTNDETDPLDQDNIPHYNPVPHPGSPFAYRGPEYDNDYVRSRRDRRDDWCNRSSSEEDRPPEELDTFHKGSDDSTLKNKSQQIIESYNEIMNRDRRTHRSRRFGRKY